MGEARTAVVCDSTAYLSAELVSSLEIGIVSLYVTLDGQTRPEVEISDYGDYYERLRDSDAGAKTAAPSVGDFTAVYEPLLERGLEVVSIHISGVISATWEVARQARQQLIDEGKGGERIHVYDSRSAAGGLGVVVLAAARAASLGGDPETALERARAAREELTMWFAVDTLEYLRKGGRIGPARAWLGSALQIKPILTLEEEITPIERVRTSRRAFERLTDFGRELSARHADGWVVQHVQNSEGAARLVDATRETIGREPLFVSEVGPVIGSHTGPGLLGIGGVARSTIYG